jgi:hypothetical protein
VSFFFALDGGFMQSGIESLREGHREMSVCSLAAALTEVAVKVHNTTTQNLLRCLPHARLISGIQNLIQP